MTHRTPLPLRYSKAEGAGMAGRLCICWTSLRMHFAKGWSLALSRVPRSHQKHCWSIALSTLSAVSPMRCTGVWLMRPETALLWFCSERGTATQASDKALRGPVTIATAESAGAPSVMVPVLSKTMASSLAEVSRAAAVLTRQPRFAATPVATITAIGVAKPIAQGHAIIRTAMPNFMAKSSFKEPSTVSGSPPPCIAMLCAPCMAAPEPCILLEAIST
mmetsp:Transcript_66872/g.142975  ORF Transcript_66872/g.142975 Transcript_66872/m.142975 type:complete len:219 (-) Transcript_66872:1335-1991(-)